MTDEEMDARLQAAGAAWRSGTVEPAALATIDAVPLVPSATRPSRGHRTAWLVSAAAVLAGLVGVGAFLLGRGTAPTTREAAGVSSLEGRSWRLAGIDLDGKKVAVAGHPTLILRDGRISGTDGCNSFSGPVRVDGDVLRIDALASTEIGCLDPGFAGSVDAITSALRGRVTWRLQGADLTLSNRGITLTYVPAPASVSSRPPNQDPAVLLGSWKLTGGETNHGNSGTGWAISSGGSASGVRGPGVTFTAGHVRIVHGCYTNTADVTAGRGTLDVTNVQLVRGLPCPSNGVTDVDHQLDDVVSGRVTWTVHGQTLKITNGATTLDFERSHR